ALQADAVLGERLEGLRVARLPLQGVEQDPGMAQVGFDEHRGHGEELEPLVVQLLDLVRHDLPDELVQPGRARVLAGGAVGAGTTSHHETSIQSRSTWSTSTSGKDHTKRSTWSSTSATWAFEPDKDAKPSCARCHFSWWAVSAAATW